MEHGPTLIQDVLPIGNGDIPFAILVYQKSKIYTQHSNSWRKCLISFLAGAGLLVWEREIEPIQRSSKSK